MNNANRPVTPDGKNLEIERKFLIEYPDVSCFEKYKDAKKAEITQIYFDLGDEKKLRVRKWEGEGRTVYYLTKKKKITDIIRIEEECEISGKDYHDMPRSKEASNLRIISKTRYSFPYEGHIVEVDVFPFWNDKAVAEVELEDPDEEIKLPEELTVIKDVSEEKEYTNYSMAQKTDFTEISEKQFKIRV